MDRINSLLNKISNLRLQPYRPLPYGTLSGNTYCHPLLHWQIELPQQAIPHLKSEAERKKQYQEMTSGRLSGTKQRINEILRWTDLIQFRKGDAIFSSRIRRKGYFENIDFKKAHQDWVNILKNDAYMHAVFDYKISRLQIGKVSFDTIAFSEIKSRGKTFSTPMIRLTGRFKNLIIQQNLSFVTAKDKAELMAVILNAKMG